VFEGSTGAEATYTHVSYDGLGRKEWESNQTSSSGDTGDEVPNSEIKDFEYDLAGRLITVTLPEPESGAGNPVYRYIYDDYGNQAGILDPLYRLTIFEYDHLHRQRAKYMPFAITQAQYDAIYDLDVTDSISIAEEMYGLLPGAPATPDAEFWDYDELGRLKLHTDFKGQVAGCFYDSIGRLEYKKYYADYADYPNDPCSVTLYEYDV
jgi:hypothetical protein